MKKERLRENIQFHRRLSSLNKMARLTAFFILLCSFIQIDMASGSSSGVRSNTHQYDALHNGTQNTTAYSTPINTEQSESISGQITNEAGEPIPGATIVVKGKALGTVSNPDGSYVLKGIPANATIIFSFIGMVTQEIAVGKKTTINVVLKELAIGVEEVVVIGYGVQKKQDATGSVQGVSSKDFNNGLVLAPEQLLTGKVAGLSITANGGEPGAASQIRLRGGTSINAGNEPLFVIDGVPIDNSGGFSSSRNPLNSINPSDIKDITVLKDASATAIYGSRGANGVIIINTKRGMTGKKGVQEVNFNSYVSMSNIDKTYDVLSADEFRNYITQNASSRLSMLGNANTNWQDEIYRTAITHSEDLSVTGGAEKMGYRLSLGYQSQEGIIKSSSTERISSALSLNHLLFDDRVEVASNVKMSITNDDFADGGAIGSALSLDPTLPVYADNNDFGGFYEYPQQKTPNNPLALLEMRQNKAYGIRSLGNIDLSYKLHFCQNIKLKMNLGYDVSSGLHQSFIPILAKGDVQNGTDNGEIHKESYFRFSKLMETYLNWNQEFKEISSKFDVVGGYSYQDFRSEYMGLRSIDLTSDVLGLNSTAPATTLYNSTGKDGNKLISFFGRFNYGFHDRYLLTATVRTDGSSRFSESKRWGVFPSVSTAWRITEESFFRKSTLSKTISNLKLRLGWGITGNQEIGNYRYMPTYTLGDSRVMAQFGNRFLTTLRPNGVDKDLKWEETSQVNIGLDYGIFNNRISGSFEWYKKNTNDLLFTVSVPQPYLNTQILTNIGSVENTGIEFTLDTYPIAKKNVNWNVSFNIAHNKNKITGLDNNIDPDFRGYEVGGIGGGTGNTIQLLKVGEEAYSFFVYEHIIENGQPIYKDMNSDGIVNAQDLYKDQNNDGTINEFDKIIKGSPAPKLVLGISSNLTVNKFDFGFSLQGNIGNNVYNNVASQRMATQQITSENVPRNILRKALEINFAQPQYLSDYFIEDGSFLRLQNITLGYNINLSRTKSNARIYFTGQNLLVLTEYSGLDPENTGIDNNLYPRSRTFLVGLNLNF